MKSRCDMHPNPECLYFNNDTGKIVAEDEENCEDIYRIKGTVYILGCAIKDLWGLCANSEYCRIVVLPPVIPYTQRNNW